MIAYSPAFARGMGFSFSSLVSGIESVALAPVQIGTQFASSVVGTVLHGVGSVLPAAGAVAGSTLHSLGASAVPPPAAAAPPSNLPLYIGLGAGALVLLLVLTRRGSAPAS